MKVYSIKKGDLSKLFSSFTKKYDLIAPIKEGSNNASKTLFKRIDKACQMFLDGHTYFPVKGFFFDSREVIFDYKDGKILSPQINIRPRIFFGLRECDLTSIKHQDMVFLEENIDPFYKHRRDSSILIGLHCKGGDEFCFCDSIKVRPIFDLMLYDTESSYLVEVGSIKGQNLIKKFQRFFAISKAEISPELKQTVNKKKLNKLDINSEYRNDLWKKGSDKCLSCGACNFLCPNCHCFTIEDEINLDLSSGKRIRTPESCQLRHFTRVAGDHIFRIDKLARFKHRIYHQIQYFKDRHGEIFCTGCGRCIKGCPARIDWVEIVNEMSK